MNPSPDVAQALIAAEAYLKRLDARLTRHGYRWAIMHAESGLQARIWQAGRMQKVGNSAFRHIAGPALFRQLELLADECCPSEDE